MKCPKCDANMEQVNTPFADLERCTDCKGLWLDMLEHEDLKPIAESVDTGNPELGKANNEIGDIRCPVCPNSQMLRMVDADQPHIWYESCPTCFGRYYDAGELVDLSHKTFSDFIKDLFAPERK
jgi:Zn-finger nucleic acid-binding protein